MTHEHRCYPLGIIPAASIVFAVVGSLLRMASTKSARTSATFLRNSPTQYQDNYYHHRTLANILQVFADPKSVESRNDLDYMPTLPSPIKAGRGEGRRRLIHVTSPYHDPSSADFTPLNFEQWSMLASVQIAQERFFQKERNDNAMFDEVVLVCAILEEDSSVLNEVLPPYCQRVVVLPRSTAKEYPYLKPKALPFLQDIVDAGMREATVEAESQDDEYYVMLTNSDICLTPDFYSNLERILMVENSNALAINRMTIDMKNVDLPRITDEDSSFDAKHSAANNLLDQAANAYGHNQFTEHPGKDCFIMHSSVLKMVRLGNFFSGYPFWGANLGLALNIMGTNYTNIKSNTGGTFHLGNNEDWRPRGKPKAEDMIFWNEFGTELEYLLWCPIMIGPPQEGHSLQELINCGKWFKPTEQSNPIPAFVQPGYEHVYLENFAKYLSFGKDGLPTLLGKPTPEVKMGWIQQYAPKTIKNGTFINEYSDKNSILDPKTVNLLPHDERSTGQADSSNHGWVRPDVIYGHVHMAKTAGTEINGELAMHFERVCGHKGYSYDAFSNNERVKKKAKKDKVLDYYNSRNRVPHAVMKEIGFHDCDYISLEFAADNWSDISKISRMELHVPCRDPLSHLMSQCNHKDITFSCDSDEFQDLELEVERCNVFMNVRYDDSLKTIKNAKLKCFNPMPPSKYIDFMSNILQRKRIETDYFHVESNKPRNKTNECIWDASEDFQKKVQSVLLEKYAYYRFCDDCMTSEDKLPID